MLGDSKKSLEIDLEVYEKRKKLFGENHPDCLATLQGISVSVKLFNFYFSTQISVIQRKV